MVRRRPGIPADRRGQAFTLEAFMASLLLVGAIIFALQVTAVTPLTASTSSQHIENQQLQVASGLLDSAVSNGSLREAVLYWNGSAGQFYGVNDEEGYYAVGGPPGLVFGEMLNRTFRARGIAFDVNVWYVGVDGDLRQEEMVNFGTPSDNAVSARRTITLFDDDRLTSPESSDPVDEVGTFYAPDFAPDSGVYNVLRVEVVVWRM
ncbi:MAG: hypothetical protein ABEJ92_06215 [Halobacteriales archaeon]